MTETDKTLDEKLLYSPLESSAKRPRLQENEEAQLSLLRETDVGILEYANPGVPAVKGMLKQRYTDFQVNEIDLEGNVIHLLDLGVEDKKDRRREKREVERQQLPLPELSPEVKEELISLVGSDALDACLDILTTGGTKYEIPRVFDDKGIRTRVHSLFRQAFQGRLDTETTKDFRIVAYHRRPKLRGRAKKQDVGEMLEYLHFSVYKENRETMEVANLISRLLRIQTQSITFAGTKDRRGVTLQRFCVRKIPAGRVSGLNKTLRGVRLGSFEYKTKPLRLGDLRGNQFLIVIRKAEGDFDAALTSVRDNGFINYFGMQRFGSFSISTHLIGKYVLTGDFDTAVELILQPQNCTLPESRDARQAWHEHHDAEKALKLMPRRCVAEWNILQALSDSPSCKNAFLKIPRNLKLMYVHAYQSYVWNRVASKRFTFGLKALEGDLVIAETRDEFVRARPLSKEEAENGVKTIWDVVLPTPGYDITYPKNLSFFYEQIMKEDGIDCHNMRCSVKEFSVSGGYRHLMAKPLNMEWITRDYEDDEEQLVLTDYDLLMAHETVRAAEKENPDDRTKSDCSESQDLLRSQMDKLSARLAPTTGSSKAVVLKMDLGTSQYATMALREAFKIDTGRHGRLFL